MESKEDRQARKVAEYNSWFHHEVEKAIQEADDPNAQWVSQAEMKRQSALKRAVWLGNRSGVQPGQKSS
jgi:hypothetical protein